MIGIDDARAPTLALLREPHAKYCTAADNLRVTSWCSSAGVTEIFIRGRFLTCGGDIIAISERQVPNTDRTLKNTDFGLGEGWLLDLRIESNGSPQIGQVFARAAIVRGLSGSVSPLNLLCQGVLNAVQPLAFPTSPVITTLDAPGVLRVITGTDPAAGAEISETVPTGARWRFISLRATLVSDATVANRTPNLVFDDGATIYAASGVNFNQAASLSFTYNFGHVGQTFTQTSIHAQVTTPDNLILLAGHRIRTSTGALQVGDNWGAPILLVEETLEAAA